MYKYTRWKGKVAGKRRGGWRMHFFGGGNRGWLFNAYYHDTTISFWSNKDEVIRQKTNTYRYDGKERRDLTITIMAAKMNNTRCFTTCS